MFFLDHSMPSVEENLAWDEALIEAADEHSEHHAMDVSELETLRVWEMPNVCVVVGRSSRVAEEVDVANCNQDNVRVVRRMSGGASIVAGPGCLMYSVLLSLENRPHLRDLTAAHQFVMEHTRMALESSLLSHGLTLPVSIQGTCDLTLGDDKVSGNSLRVKRHWMMYHGTLLYEMPVELIARYLKTPPQQPEYRARRPHENFVTSLDAWIREPSKLLESLKKQLAAVWQAEANFEEFPLQIEVADQIACLMESRYLNANWHTSR